MNSLRLGRRSLSLAAAATVLGVFGLASPLPRHRNCTPGASPAAPPTGTAAQIGPPLQVPNGDGAYVTYGGASVTASLNVAATLSDLNYSGAATWTIADAAANALTFSNSGGITNYWGTTTPAIQAISGGTLAVNAPLALATAGGTLTVGTGSGGGSIDLNNSSTAFNGTLELKTGSSSGSIVIGAWNPTGGGGILYDQGGGTVALGGGGIGSNVPITMSSSGLMTLAGSNPSLLQPITVNSGTFETLANGALGSAGLGKNSVFLNGGTFSLLTYSETAINFTQTGGTLAGSTGNLVLGSCGLQGGSVSAGLIAPTVTKTGGDEILSGGNTITTLNVSGGRLFLDTLARDKLRDYDRSRRRWDPGF